MKTHLKTWTSCHISVNIIALINDMANVAKKQHHTRIDVAGIHNIWKCVQLKTGQTKLDAL